MAEPLSTLRLEPQGTTLVVHFDNGPTDLLDRQVFADLDTLTRRLTRDDRFRAVVLTGPRPEVFAPHYDLAEIADGAEELGISTPYRGARIGIAIVAAASKVKGAEKLLRRTPAAGLVEILATHRTLARFGRLPQVVIAAIGGDALGGGCEVALACDLRIMADGDFLIGLPEISAGIPPGAGGSVRLARAVGSSRAAAMMLRARPLDPTEALAAGLVDQVLPQSELLAEAHRIAERVGQWNPTAVRSVKRTLAAVAGSSTPFRVEAAGFVAAASGRPAIDRLRVFGEQSDPARGTSPWQDRSWLDRRHRS
ncbi:MAG: enoyl-CoA hydratase/isomerase family protein [Candidatus Nanopelagicales bacterium]